MSIGTTRNLTQQFVKLRNEAKLARPDPDIRIDGLGESASLLGKGPDSNAKGSSPPSWLNKSEKIKADMGVLKERITRLKETHDKSLLVTFNTDNDAQSHSDALTREIQSTFRRLDLEIRNIDKGASTEEDAAVRLQVQRQLAQALVNLSLMFRKEEMRFLNKVEAQKGLAAGSTIGLESEALVSEDPADVSYTQMQLAMVDMAQHVAEERDQEIRKIVESITELAQIMRDLSALVVQQGTMLDRIDCNITQVAVKVEEGVKELKVAEKTQKAGRMILCMLALVVLIVLMLILVIVRHTSGFKHSSSSSSSSSPSPPSLDPSPLTSSPTTVP